MHYNDTDEVEPNQVTDCYDPAVLTLLRERQMFDFRPLRLRDPLTEDVAMALDTFSTSIRRALRRGASAVAPAPKTTAKSTVVKTPPPGPQPGDIVRDGPDYPEMVLIPAGTYLRGVPEAEDERENHPKVDRWAQPQRTVTIPSPFWLGRFSVTRGEFAAFVNNTGYKTRDKAWTFEADAKGTLTWEERSGRGWRNPGLPQTDRDPVVCVSHDDAMAYIEWLNDRTKGGYRLSSEAEWEYAARARTMTARYWGDSREGANLYANGADRKLMTLMKATFDPERFFDCDDGYAFTAPVGSFKANAFHLHDTLGHVWEWCADHWHDSYNGAPGNGSVWETGGDSGRRVLRGGSWNGIPGDLRAGVRDHVVRGFRNFDASFRLARTLSAPSS